MNLSFIRAFIFVIGNIICSTSIAQTPSPRDTSRRPGSSAISQVPKPYKEVITNKAVTSFGFFNVHKVEDKYYLEIPDRMLGREILVVNRLSKTQVGMGYGGDRIGQSVVRLEKGPNNKIFLRTISYAVYAKDSTSPIMVQGSLIYLS